MIQVLKRIANTSVNTFSLAIMSIRPLFKEIWTVNTIWRTNDVPRQERVKRERDREREMRERKRVRESTIHHSSWEERIACPSLIDGSCSARSVLFAHLCARSFSLLDNLFHTGPHAHTTCLSWRSHSALALSLSLSLRCTHAPTHITSRSFKILRPTLPRAQFSLPPMRAEWFDCCLCV
jgi:hypothetical protein